MRGARPCDHLVVIPSLIESLLKVNREHACKQNAYPFQSLGWIEEYSPGNSGTDYSRNPNVVNRTTH